MGLTSLEVEREPSYEGLKFEVAVTVTVTVMPCPGPPRSRHSKVGVLGLPSRSRP